MGHAARYPFLPYITKDILELGKVQRRAAMLTKCIENPVDEKKRLWKQEDHGEYGWELIVHLFTTTRIRVCYVKLPVAKSKTEKRGYLPHRE